ncbi:MAG TPA: hypothetical protein VHG92_11725 [Afifellaceae bacterium]|nr:hypothetical protein [Afifellaceae bacterium]
MKAVRFALATAVAIGSASLAFAETEMKVAERFTGTGVAFELEGTYSNITLTVTGPDDYHQIAKSEKGAPKLDLREGGTLSNGVYTYQLSGATSESKKIVREYLDNGRDRGAEPMVGAAARGTFLVQEGSIVKVDPAESEKR